MLYIPEPAVRLFLKPVEQKFSCLSRHLNIKPNIVQLILCSIVYVVQYTHTVNSR